MTIYLINKYNYTNNIISFNSNTTGFTFAINALFERDSRQYPARSI